MQITVATLHFGSVPYFQYSEAINRKYCERHGYRFEIIRPPRQIQRSPIWFKVDGVMRLLHEASIVLFLDADAYFVDASKRIESVVDEHMGGAVILFGNDRRDRDFAWSDDNANCGVFIVRQSAEAFSLLAEWWRVPLEDRQWLWRWPSEQGAFNQHVRQGRHASTIKIISYIHLNGMDGSFIRHLLGCSDIRRLALLRQQASTVPAVTDDVLKRIT